MARKLSSSSQNARTSLNSPACPPPSRGPSQHVVSSFPIRFFFLVPLNSEYDFPKLLLPRFEDQPTSPRPPLNSHISVPFHSLTRAHPFLICIPFLYLTFSLELQVGLVGLFDSRLIVANALFIGDAGDRRDDRSRDRDRW
uniref:(northern house mosquito) hypothetical protein n=1 Tax=Culex pipiens TaxID=7175 RepID=A0A8D8C3R1_CULPI